MLCPQGNKINRRLIKKKMVGIHGFYLMTKTRAIENTSQWGNLEDGLA